MENKICGICKKEIFEKSDRYVKIEDWFQKKCDGTAYAHQFCWRNWHNLKVQWATGMAMKGMLNNIPAIAEKVREAMVQ